MTRRIVGHSFVWLVVALLLTANLMVGARLYQQDAEAGIKEEAYDMIALLTTVTQQIRQHYVDPEKTSYKDLIYGALRGMLQSLSPVAVLARGYSITQSANTGRIVRDAAEIAAGQEITTRLHRGRLTSTVSESRTGEMRNGES